MIERAEHLGSRHCKDHSHPVFRITLTEPEDPQARVLAELLEAQPAASPQPAAPAQLARRRGGGHGGFGQSCWEVCFDGYAICVAETGSLDLCEFLYGICCNTCTVLGPIVDPIFPYARR